MRSSVSKHQNPMLLRREDEKGEGGSDLHCVCRFPQLVAFRCAHFQFGLTTYGAYAVMDCVEKCKEAFNSDCVRRLSLCSQMKAYCYHRVMQ